MLFYATTVNYMDRQVLGILSPTLQHSIGWNEVQYGYIISAFQIAYAVGLLVAGRVIDRVGTRVGYAIVMAVWSVAAASHALARTPLGFGIARFFLGLGESGNFPAALKTIAEWFPQRGPLIYCLEEIDQPSGVSLSDAGANPPNNFTLSSGAICLGAWLCFITRRGLRTRSIAEETLLALPGRDLHAGMKSAFANIADARGAQGKGLAEALYLDTYVLRRLLWPA